MFQEQITNIKKLMRLHLSIKTIFYSYFKSLVEFDLEKILKREIDQEANKELLDHLIEEIWYVRRDHHC